MPPVSSRSRCLPSWETAAGALSSSGVGRCRRWPAEAAAARVHRGSREPRLDPCSYAIRVRLQGRVRSHDFCKCMFPRARPRTTSNIPNDRNPSLGRLPDRSKVAFRPGNRRSFTGTGIEQHRCSTLPTETAPGRDFAPTLIAPGTSCREDRSSPCPERRGRRAEPPAQHTLARCAPREGRAALNLREEAERSPTRGAFGRQAVRDANGRDCRGPASRTASTTAPFSPSTEPGEGRSLGP